MSLVITSVTGEGSARPPATIRIEGGSGKCEEFEIRISCSNEVRSGGGLDQLFSFDFTNQSGCDCGDTITIFITCYVGRAAQQDTIMRTIVCPPSDCPVVALTASIASECDAQGLRLVSIVPSISGGPGSEVFEIDFGDGSPASNPIAVIPGRAIRPIDHRYPPGKYTATLSLLQPSACPGASTSLQIDACSDGCCPILTLAPPDVSGCGTGAGASFSANLSWPPQCQPVAPAGYLWTVEISRVLPGTPQPTIITYQRQTSTPNASAADAWTDRAGHPLGPITFEPDDAASVSVRAVIPNVPATCDPTATRAFGIKACCPRFAGDLKATVDQQDPCTLNVAATVDNPIRVPVSVEWSLPGGVTRTTTGVGAALETFSVAHRYPAGTTSGAVSARIVPAHAQCPPVVSAGVPVEVTCAPPPPEVIQPPRMPEWCWALLLVSMGLWIAGAIAFGVGWCGSSTPNVAIASIGGGLALAALAMLTAWLLACGRNHCEIIDTLAKTLLAMTATAGLVSIFAAIASAPGIADILSGEWWSEPLKQIVTCVLANGIFNTTVLGIATGLVHWLGSTAGCKIVYGRQP
jgi:hypothetical protein